MFRILYAGSPECAAQPLVDIVKSGTHKVVGVLTNPSAPKGRSGTPVPTPVAQAVARLFEESGADPIPVLTPEKLDAAAREAVAALNPDILVCFAYGRIFGPKFLALFKNGGINIHPSLLPRYRGCAPIPAAIRNRDSKTGITIQRVALEMDSGAILSQRELPLAGTETTESLTALVSSLGGPLVLDVLDRMEEGVLREIPQDENGVTYCRLLQKNDGCIDWSRGADEIDALIRASTPWPGAFTCVAGVRLHILSACPYAGGISGLAQAAPSGGEQSPAEAGTVLGTDREYGILIQTGNGILAVSQLQWQAKRAMNWRDFMNGNRHFTGSTCT